MFYTRPEAEILFPQALAPLGERGWRWVECALQIPYFFFSARLEIEGGSCRRHFLFSQLRDVMGLIATSGDSLRDLEMDLLSPAYMNGGCGYQFGRVKEIWTRRNGHEQMFVMLDGTRYHFPPGEHDVLDEEMVLLISLPFPVS